MQLEWLKFLINVRNNAMFEILNYPLTIIKAPMQYGKTTAFRDKLDFHNGNILP